MSCEEAKAREERSKKRLLETERELLSTNTPLLGRVTLVTEEEMQAIKEVQNRHVDAFREWIEDARARLAASVQHRD